MHHYIWRQIVWLELQTQQTFLKSVSKCTEREQHSHVFVPFIFICPISYSYHNDPLRTASHSKAIALFWRYQIPSFCPQLPSLSSERLRTHTQIRHKKHCICYFICSVIIHSSNNIQASSLFKVQTTQGGRNSHYEPQ